MVITKLPYTYIAKGRYWRFRRNGIDAPLPGKPGDPAFHSKYSQLLAQSQAAGPKLDTNSLAWLIARYRRSAEFKVLRPATQLDYDKTLRIVEAELGDEPYAYITRGMVKIVRDDMVETPRKAQKFVLMVSALYSWAQGEDLVPDDVNPAAGIKRLKVRQNPYVVWSEPEIALFLANAPRHVVTPVMLALFTGQRREDVVRMDWQDFQGGIIRVRQSKTGEPIEVPCHPALQKHLSAIRSKFGGPIARAANGRPYTANSLSQALRRACADIEGMPNRTMHGLRYAAAGRLEEGGATPGQVASILGHRAFAMAMKYMLARREAEAAMARMGNGNRT